jgi:hypothetical protein
MSRIDERLSLLGLRLPEAPAAPPGVEFGFSDLIVELWGDPGRHARSAIGVAELPFDIPVEIEAIVRL